LTHFDFDVGLAPEHSSAILSPQMVADSSTEHSPAALLPQPDEFDELDDEHPKANTSTSDGNHGHRWTGPMSLEDAFDGRPVSSIADPA
jgi:hypothetical protein